MSSGIYAITNMVNGHRYVGSAVDLAKRWSGHRVFLRKGKHCNRHLQSAWAKYGEPAFHFMLLEDCAPDELIAAEQSWMDTFQPEYNLAPTAGSSLGRHHSEETRRKISDIKKGHGFSNEALRKMSDAKKGHKLSDETRRKLSEAHKGLEFSNEHRHNMSKAQTGHKVSEETRRKLSDANMGHHPSDETRRKSEQRSCRSPAGLGGRDRQPLRGDGGTRDRPGIVGGS